LGRAYILAGIVGIGQKFGHFAAREAHKPGDARDIFCALDDAADGGIASISHVPIVPDNSFVGFGVHDVSKFSPISDVNQIKQSSYRK
jgi:hypothetical protein